MVALGSGITLPSPVGVSVTPTGKVLLTADVVMETSICNSLTFQNTGQVLAVSLTNTRSHPAGTYLKKWTDGQET